MTKLCPRGKAAAKRKFKVYPSAYANAYASKICAGKIKDPSGVKRKDFRGSKAEGGLMEATAKLKKQGLKKGGRPTPAENMQGEQRARKVRPGKMGPKARAKLKAITIEKDQFGNLYQVEKKAKGGRIGLRRGGGVCLRGMNREAVGKNS